ncbi:MAG: phosphoglycerate kinase [Desulfobacterales bacterium]|jgi:phosphoglycerate kinase
MKTIRDLSLSGKTVLVRVDFNVPLDDNGAITDDSRIRGALPTIRYGIDQGAVMVVASHLGRPKGRVVDAFRLKPAADRLTEFIGMEVSMAGDCIGEAVARKIQETAPGGVVMLENLRFHPEEESNDDAFARSLASLCDVYVNDAFAVSHRSNASVDAITRHAPVSVAGFLMEKELTTFESAMSNPARPLAAIVGGAKVSGKLGALTNLMAHVDRLLIGGAMANTFLKAEGRTVGRSLVEEDLVNTARQIITAAEEKGIGLFLPVDVIVARSMDAEDCKTVDVDQIPEWGMAMDIGPKSIRRFVEAIRDCGTIIWNGPMGVFEREPFSNGTMAVAKAVGDAEGMTIVGGGDTDAAVHRSGVAKNISYISTGGGAFLQLLEGKPLPGVQALERSAG